MKSSALPPPGMTESSEPFTLSMLWSSSPWISVPNRRPPALGCTDWMVTAPAVWFTMVIS